MIPVDGDVQTALRDIADATADAMRESTNTPARYEPSEKYGPTEYLVLPIDDPFSIRMKELHQAANPPTDAKALEDPVDLICYFARLTDGQGRRLTGLRRASQFKAILKSRLIRLLSDALTLIEDHVFKLDRDFDLLVDDKRVHILRPSAFEFAGKLQQAVLAAVPTNVKEIRADLPFASNPPVNSVTQVIGLAGSSCR